MEDDNEQDPTNEVDEQETSETESGDDMPSNAAVAKGDVIIIK